MERRIKLTRLQPTEVNLNNYGAYRIRIEASNPEGADLDENIFIYRTVDASPYTDANRDVFEAVAGPGQLALYPIGLADPDQGWPYYRLDYVELDVLSASQAESIWTEIKSQVGLLITSLERLEKLKTIEEVWLPGPPTDTSQSSQSI